MKRAVRGIHYLIIVTILITFFNSALAVDKISETNGLDFNQITSFFEERINNSVEKDNIPGVSIAIVKGDQVFTKGFGFADVRKKVLVTEDTSFKIASITKLFTTIGIMQLVQQGELDLDSDIRTVLEEFEYNNKYTLKVSNLLTHTSGFDESLINYQSLGFGSNVKLEDFIYKNQPELIRKPGEFTQYNNYAFALAGYILQEISGVDYKQYIIENIFKPLDMTNSSFNFEDNMDDIALEYVYQNGLLKPVYEYSLDAYPAGAITSSADDMVKFLFAMTNIENKESKSILKAGTLQTMQTKQFSNHPDLAGICYGFIENVKNGHRFIGHGGSLMGISSELLIDLENELGIFIVANSNNSNEVTIELIEGFIEEFYSLQPSSNGEKEISNLNIEGKYYSNRFSRNTIEKMQLLFAPQIEVKSLDSKSIEVSGIGPTKTYQHLGDFLFVDNSTGRKIAFEFKGGEIYFYPFLPDWTLTKFKLYQNPIIHLVIIGVSLIVFFINIISFLINKCIKHKEVGKVRVLSVLTSIVNLSFIILLIYQIVTMTTITEIGFGVAFSLKLILLLPLVSIILLIIQLTILIKGFINGELLVREELLNLISVIIFGVFIALLNFYNLIGFKY